MMKYMIMVVYEGKQKLYEINSLKLLQNIRKCGIIYGKAIRK